MIERTLHDGAARLLYGAPNLESLGLLADGSVHCVVTSPPYWNLRDYGAADQFGLEGTPEQFVEGLVEIFREIRRVLHGSGTVWLNLGDSYANKPVGSLKNKDLAGIPWRVALALQADGWWLRQDIIWHKPNPMPESARDRCCKAHEYIFLLSKSERYYFDGLAIAEPATGRDPGNLTHKMASKEADGVVLGRDRDPNESLAQMGARSTRTKRSVWTIGSKPYSGAHFAVFPEEIPRLAILAGTSAGGVCGACGDPLVPDRVKIGERVDRWSATNSYAGYRERQGTAIFGTAGWLLSCDCEAPEIGEAVVLDPFSGSGTTGKIALQLKRRYIGLDVHEGFLDLALRRVDQYAADSPSRTEDDGQMALFTGVDSKEEDSE